MPPQHEVLIKATTGGLAITALLGEGVSKITDGSATWQVIARPRKTGLTQYMGRNPFKMSLSLLFDGYLAGESQETKIRQLTWLALPEDTGKEPRKVYLYGALPFPSGGEWVIDSVTWGDNVIWTRLSNGSDVRLRQNVDITLLQYVPADRIELLVKNTGIAPKTPGRVHVKKGDSLRKLATTYYADFKLWYLIADANHLRDPIIKKDGWITIPPLH